MLSRSASSSVAARAISSHSAAGTTLSYCPSISRGPRGPEVPAVLPRLAAAAGLAQASPRPPAHVGPQPRLLPVRSSVLAVGHVHPGQTLHERPGLQQPGGQVLHNPHQGVKVRNDLKPPGAAAGASSARGCIPCRRGWPRPCRSAPKT